MEQLPRTAALLATLFLSYLSTPQLCRTTSSTQRDAKERASVDFCHQNHFQGSDTFRTLVALTEANVAREAMAAYMHAGLPFVVSGVTEGWPANSKWNHSFFDHAFRDHSHDVFSSTFSTPVSPDIAHPSTSVHEIYYGMFLNDPTLAEHISADYSYPEFVPEEWRETGACTVAVSYMFPSHTWKIMADLQDHPIDYNYKCHMSFILYTSQVTSGYIGDFPLVEPSGTWTSHALAVFQFKWAESSSGNSIRWWMRQRRRQGVWGTGQRYVRASLTNSYPNRSIYHRSGNFHR